MEAWASLWELEVKDSDPIKAGREVLRPLTMFIGANNTGKSYMAQVAYASGSLFPTGFPFSSRGQIKDYT